MKCHGSRCHKNPRNFHAKTHPNVYSIEVIIKVSDNNGGGYSFAHTVVENSSSLSCDRQLSLGHTSQVSIIQCEI